MSSEEKEWNFTLQDWKSWKPVALAILISVLVVCAALAYFSVMVSNQQYHVNEIVVTPLSDGRWRVEVHYRYSLTPDPNPPIRLQPLNSGEGKKLFEAWMAENPDREFERWVGLDVQKPNEPWLGAIVRKKAPKKEQ